MSAWTVLALGLAALGVLWWWRSRRTIFSENGINYVPTGDRDMQRAIAKAREDFHIFLDRLHRPKPGDENFAIKVGIVHDGHTENLWLTDVRVDDDDLDGEIANDPQTVPYRLGDRWRGSLDQLCDWTFFSHGRMQGNFTLRAMLPRMPRAQREQARLMLEHCWDTRELVHRPWPPNAAMTGQPLPDDCSDGDRVLIDGIGDHLEAHLGRIPQVFHELVSTSAHIDLYPYPADAARGFHVVATTGMAERAMQLPADGRGEPWTELVLLLPSHWPLDRDAWQDERHWWPLRWLKRVARFHYESGHWLGEGHVLTHGEEPTPIHPDFPYDSVLLAHSRALPDAFQRATLKDGRVVRLLCLYFLTAEERKALDDRGWEDYASEIRADRLSL